MACIIRHPLYSKSFREVVQAPPTEVTVQYLSLQSSTKLIRPMGNVLVVDDAGFVRKILIAVLSELLSTEIYEAINGNQAVEICKKHNIELVFLDLVLPEKNGVEVANTLLDRYPGLKIIAVSTMDQVWLREKALAAGCLDFLQKPFTKASVRQMIEKYGPNSLNEVGHG